MSLKIYLDSVILDASDEWKPRMHGLRRFLFQEIDAEQFVKWPTNNWELTEYMLAHPAAAFICYAHVLTDQGLQIWQMELVEHNVEDYNVLNAKYHVNAQFTGTLVEIVLEVYNPEIRRYEVWERYNYRNKPIAFVNGDGFSINTKITITA